MSGGKTRSALGKGKNTIQRRKERVKEEKEGEGGKRGWRRKERVKEERKGDRQNRRKERRKAESPKLK